MSDTKYTFDEKNNEFKESKSKKPDKKNSWGFMTFVTRVVILVFAVGIVFNFTTISVQENRIVCITRFNKITHVYDTPGLHFIVPFLDQAIVLDKSVQKYNVNSTDVFTRDKDAMIVSSYCLWRIVDPIKLNQTIGISVAEAEKKIEAAAYSSIKTNLSSLTKTEINSLRSTELDDKIMTTVAEGMRAYGLEVVDLKLKRFNLPDENKQANYNRMMSERIRLASQYEAEGNEQAEIIRNKADSEVITILSEANATAVKLIAEGEGAYMRILAEAYGTDDKVKFYEYVRSLDALEVAMEGDKTIIMDDNTAITKWFNGNN